jgi:hypothetical protein
MSDVSIETNPEALIKRRFSDAAVEIQSIERRDYPGEAIFVVYVDDQQFDRAAQLGNDLDSELETIDFKGFVTVRKVHAPAGNENIQVTKGVNDPRVNDFVSLISARSRTSEVLPSLSYVPDASNKILTAVAPRHHLIFGRRGAGKTALMVEAKRIIENEGSFSVWVNLQTLRNESAAGAFLFICQRICDCIEMAYSKKIKVPHVLIAAMGLREDLEKLSSVDAGLGEKVNSLVPRMQLLIRRFLDSSATRLYLFLDELHYLSLVEQPKLLDLLHGATRDCDAWLKIAGIKHLSRWFQTNPLMGLQTGHDADHIDLDITLENPTRGKIFLEEVLRSYSKHLGIFSLGGVFSPESLDRLVIASGAVPRDYLVLSAQAVRQAQRREKARLVGVQDVNRAAGDAAKIKIAELEDDAASAENPTGAILKGLLRVRSFCIDEKNFSYFRVDFRDKELFPVEYSMIEELMDLRLIHLVDPSLSDEREAGRRSEVYMLDLSQFSGQRLKRKLKVLDFESGHLVQKETGTNKSAKIADTGRQRLAILRRGPLFELKLFKESNTVN